MATTYYWVGGSGNTSVNTHWATSSGGAGGAGVPVAGDTINFDANSGTAATVTVDAALTVATCVLNKADLTLTLAANLTCSSTFTFTAGTFNCNSFTFATPTITSAGTATRVWNMGSAAINLTGGTGTLMNMTGTGYTQNPGTSTVTFTGGGASGIVANGPFYNLTFNGGAANTAAMQVSTDLTVNNTLILNGNNVAANRLLVQSNNIGVVRMITCNGTVTANYCDFMDITGAGTASWNLAASTGNSGDAGGNSGITFTTSATQTWQGTAGGNWSANAWSGRMPLPQDDVVVNAAFTGGQTITVNVARMGRNIDFTGVSGSPILSATIGVSIFGSLTLAAGLGSVTFGTFASFFRGRGTHTLTSAGKSIGCAFTFYSIGGTYTLQDDLNSSAGWVLSAGTLNGNNKNVTLLTFTTNTVAGSPARVLNMGNGTWTMTGTGTAWNVVSSTGLTLNPGTSTIVFNNATAALTFAGSTFTYYNFSCIVAGGFGLSITGTNTFNDFTITTTVAKTLTLALAVNTTVNGVLTLQGAAGQLLSVVSPTPGTYVGIRYRGIVILPAKLGSFVSPSGDVRLVGQRFATPVLATM